MSQLLLGMWPLGYFTNFKGILLNGKALTASVPCISNCSIEMVIFNFSCVNTHTLTHTHTHLQPPHV